VVPVEEPELVVTERLDSEGKTIDAGCFEVSGAVNDVGRVGLQGNFNAVVPGY